MTATEMEKQDSKEAIGLKEAGNSCYKDNDISGALDNYTKAIEICESSNDHIQLLATCLKNRAAVFLKDEDFESCVQDCTRALDLVPNDPKSLFRRCQAHEALNQVDSAYKDAREVHRVDPKNSVIEPVLIRLHKAVGEKLADLGQTSTKVKNMFEIVFDVAKEADKREKAADNLVVLARERAGADLLHTEGVVQKIARLMKVEKNTSIRLSLIRCIGELCKKSQERAKTVLKECGIPFFMDCVNSHNEDVVNASGYIIQIMLNTLSHYDIQLAITEKRKKGRNMSSAERKWCISEEKRRQELLRMNGKELTAMMHVITFNSVSRTITGEARDALIELIMKNAKLDELNWAELCLKTDTYQRLMEVASEMTQFKHESSMEITDNTRNVVGVCLNVMYQQMYDDARRNTFCEEIDGFIKGKLMDPAIESHVRAIAAITTLLQNAPELGSGQVGKDGVLQMMLAMAQSEDRVQQLVAAEALIAASAKKKDSSMIVTQGVDILKQLYKSKDDHIKVRALVGLCKLGASSGHDASLRPFADGSTQKLSEACRRILVNPGKDRDLRKWACEGLSYLTLDADVKEKMCEDEVTVKALIELAKTGKQDCAYGVVTCLVNMTNSFEKEEIMPEMLELAKFAKHHIPQDHELDDPDFIDKRIWTLAEWGITSALVAFSKNESINIRELIARVLNAICKFAELRGFVVQQGGSKALAGLALEGTDKGKIQAAQALARIAVTQDPAIAFPGNRAVDIVRPICQLLNPECHSLENFEALMALCNLATLNESVRSRVIKDAEFINSIEGFMFEEHILLRRASVQCWTNLCTSPLMVKRCEGKNDKVKYAVLLCGDAEDNDVVKAAIASLAMLTSQSNKICHKIFESLQWTECLLNTLANEDIEIVLRGCVTVKNLVSCSREIAGKMVETQIMDCMQAHVFKAKLDEGSAQPNPILAKIRQLSEETMKIAHSMKLVKTQDEASKETADSDEDI
jgi:tetratricopeptide (TPR) repeat protein